MTDSATPRRRGMVSRVRYEPYLMLICSNDAEWSRQRYAPGPDWFAPFLTPADKLAKSCGTYAKDIGGNHQEFCKANGTPLGDSLEPVYFDPVFYLPLGHADILSLTVLDDFDPIHQLTAQMTTTLEDLSLGFCPNPETIGARKGERLFPRIPALWESLKGRDGEIPPLLLFCKLKMELMAGLGAALPCQIALWKALVARIRSVVHSLRARLPDESTRSDFQVFDEGDIDSLRCVFLDLQGSEEIGLLLFSRNLSVATSVLGAARSLTFGDLFDAEPDLSALLGQSKLHRRIAAFSREDGTIEIAGSDLGDAVRDNHVFRWTHSDVAILPGQKAGDGGRLFCAGQRFRGYVRAVTKARVVPGHGKRAHQIGRDPGDASAENARTFRPLADEYCPLVIGPYGAMLEHAADHLQTVDSPAVLLGSVVDNIECVIKRLCIGDQASSPRTLRDIFDFETLLTVPVPKLKECASKAAPPTRPGGHAAAERPRDLIWTDLGRAHVALMAEILPLVKSRLCFPSEDERKRLAAKFEGCRPGGLDLDRLRREQRALGIPVPLRRSIEYIFQDYYILMSDPFTCDVVLDLYDTFATLHAILTDHLPKIRLGRVASSDGLGRPLLDETRVYCLAEIAEALQNALSHRVAHIFPDVSHKDMAIDFRGGLSQILHAADTAVKCGLGVVRRFVGPEDRSQRRDSVGCVIRIGMMPGARCCSLDLGVEDKAQLAYFDVDVPHILHVASYADYLHEAFHLVFKSALRCDEAFRSKVHTDNSPTLDRLEEIFSLMLSRMFIFGADSDVFLYNNICAFSRDISSVGENDTETCQRFTEVLLRHFFAVFGMGRSGDDPRFWEKQYAEGALDDVKGVRKEFERTLAQAGPFFSEFQRLWQANPQSRAYALSLEHFRHFFKDVREFLPALRELAITVYGNAMKELLPVEDPETLQRFVNSIKRQVELGLRHGNLLVWSASEQPQGAGSSGNPAEASQNLDGGALDPLVFISQILYRYIRTIGDAVTRTKGENGAEDERKVKEIHLRRNSELADVVYSGRSDWHIFQADKGSAAMFCPVPQARRERLKKQIVVLKSFWDVASEFRARRLLDIMFRNAVVPSHKDEKSPHGT